MYNTGCIQFLYCMQPVFIACAVCILSADPQKRPEISSPAMGSPVRKKEFRIAAGAQIRHGNMFFFQACSQHDLVICLPEIQLVFAIRLAIKQSISTCLPGKQRWNCSITSSLTS